MPKKKIVSEEVLSEAIFEETVKELKQELRKVEPLAFNFSNEDLNKLRDKVNELVELANK